MLQSLAVRWLLAACLPSACLYVCACMCCETGVSCNVGWPLALAC